ncbi:MAG TPA: hypothetical protein VF017_04855 [Thermoanaerobaculia bacterium]|nr:hypothetical protein [Thermoanaerobaculia bacterium]
MTTQNPKFEHVKVAFDNVPQQGKPHTFTVPLTIHIPYFPHIQGIVHYGNRFVLSHNLFSPYNEGLYVVMSTQSWEVTQVFWTPDSGYPHPGGMQVIGDYLVAPIEDGGPTKSRVHFYDLSTMTDTSPPTLLATYVDRPSGGAGAAGMTSYTVGDTEYYLLAVYDNGALDFYQWEGSPAPSDNSQSPLFSVTLNATDYSAVCLLTGTDQKVYLIGFHTKDYWGTNQDWASLHHVDLDSQTVEAPLDKRHMETTHGLLPGALGVHFRYGAGLAIIPGTGDADASLKFYATARNFFERQLTTNSF